jgi:hypothetical protein
MKIYLLLVFWRDPVNFRITIFVLGDSVLLSHNLRFINKKSLSKS